VVDLGQHHAGSAQAVVDGMKGQFPGRERQRALAVLDTREAFFFGGGHHGTVNHDHGRRVMERGIDAQGDHEDGLRRVGAAAPAASQHHARQTPCPCSAAWGAFLGDFRRVSSGTALADRVAEADTRMAQRHGRGFAAPMHSAPTPALAPFPVTAVPPHEQARADFYALIGALLLAPSAGLLQALAVAPPLPAGRGDATLVVAWQALVAAAGSADAAAVQREHAALFVAVGPPPVDPYASRYLHGSLNDAPLARLRADLRGLGLARQRRAAVTEDHLGALCETMRLLVGGGPGLAPQPLAVQRFFFEAHLAPWVDACLFDIGLAAHAHAEPPARFYAALVPLAQAFFDMERAAWALEPDPDPEPAHEPPFFCR